MKKINLIRLLILLVGIILLGSISTFVYPFNVIFSDAEDADYKLYAQLAKVGTELKAYKKQHSYYPATIFAVTKTDILCASRLFIWSLDNCREVHYQVSPDRNNFVMTMHSYTEVVLFYDPRVSVTGKEESAMTEEERSIQGKTYGMCYFCFVRQNPGTKEYVPDDAIFSSKSIIFDNIQQWPGVD